MARYPSSFWYSTVCASASLWQTHRLDTITTFWNITESFPESDSGYHRSLFVQYSSVHNECAYHWYKCSTNQDYVNNLFRRHHNIWLVIWHDSRLDSHAIYHLHYHLQGTNNMSRSRTIRMAHFFIKNTSLNVRNFYANI
ncbi:MAG: hypothetical protein UV08_C0007G0018 [Parcubacteria group bacterium GW2011_GWA2_42_18]|nr:MAG: hypothetical protein UV08_C0007G0018 [Parcubacteria group bacterium GW2011_GWA2_42_18]